MGELKLTSHNRTEFSNQKLLKQEQSQLATMARVKYFDIVLAKGHGAMVEDVEGNEYLDMLASASATNTGHCHPHVVAAIKAQAERLIQYTPAYFAIEPAAKLADKLTKLAPISGEVEVAWGNSGSDANDAIIKLARAYTKRQYCVSFTGAYHGSTYGSLSMSGVSLNMSRKIGPLLPGMVKLPFPDEHLRQSYENEEQFGERMWQEFLHPFENYLPAEEVALVEMEVIQGDGGIIAAPKEFVQRVAKFCHEHGIVFAVDEVNQGLARTGKMWSVENFGVEPDLISVGKSLAAGMPLSAVLGRKEIMESLAAPANVFTTAGNPVTTAAALANLEVIENERLAVKSQRLGAAAKDFFEKLAQKYPQIGSVRMYGLDGGIDIVDPMTKQPDADACTKLIYRLFELGVIMISLRGNILRFQPPLVITAEQLNAFFNKFEQAVSELAAGNLSLPDNASEVGW